MDPVLAYRQLVTAAALVLTACAAALDLTACATAVDLTACATSGVKRFTWFAPDGTRHRAGREVDAHVQLDPGEDRGPGSLACSRDADCRERPGGVCRTTWVPAAYKHHNCIYDECRNARDCGAGAICVPPGVWFETYRCIRASCRSNADCKQRPGGHCRFMSERFGCIYRDDPCDVKRSCPKRPEPSGMLRDMRCVLTDGGARCEPDPGPPP